MVKQLITYSETFCSQLYFHKEISLDETFCLFSKIFECCFPRICEYFMSVESGNVSFYCILLTQLWYHKINNSVLPSNSVIIPTSLCLKRVIFKAHFPFILFWQGYALVKRCHGLWYMWLLKCIWVITALLWFVMLQAALWSDKSTTCGFCFDTWALQLKHKRSRR